MCPDNELRGTGGQFLIIDQILTLQAPGKNALAPLCGTQILTQRHPYRKLDGTTIELEDSDHYGFEMDFR